MYRSFGVLQPLQTFQAESSAHFRQKPSLSTARGRLHEQQMVEYRFAK